MPNKQPSDNPDALSGDIGLSGGLTRFWGTDDNGDHVCFEPQDVLDKEVALVRPSLRGSSEILLGGVAAGATSGRDQITKTAAIPNNTATTVATITIPNGDHTAMILVIVGGALGAGGALGVNEAARGAMHLIIVTRKTGVAAAADISAAIGAVADAVAGAATVSTMPVTVTSPSGAVGDPNTIDIQVAIARSGGSSTNHIALVYAKILNFNATGVSIA